MTPNARGAPNAGVPTRPDRPAVLARVRLLKKRAMAATILGFGVFSWLAIPHGTGHATTTPVPAPASGTAQNDPSAGQPPNSQSQSSQPQGSQSQGGFFNQGGGGYGFGSGQSAPVAGSGAS